MNSHMLISVYNNIWNKIYVSKTKIFSYYLNENSLNISLATDCCLLIKSLKNNSSREIQCINKWLWKAWFGHLENLKSYGHIIWIILTKKIIICRGLILQYIILSTNWSTWVTQKENDLYRREILRSSFSKNHANL